MLKLYGSEGFSWMDKTKKSKKYVISYLKTHI